MSAQVIRVCADGRRLVRDDELARLVRDIEHHCGVIFRSPSAWGLNLEGLAGRALRHFDALDAQPPSDRVEHARALLASAMFHLDALVAHDNRPPCPVIPLRPAAKVPEPPAKGKPNRGPAAKREPERAPGARSGYDGGGDRSEKQLRAIAERAPEQVRELYRKGLLGQKEAAKLGPKNPNPAAKVRDRRGPRG